MTAWLEERRRTAAEQNEALAIPSGADEHWRFTSLRGIDFAAYASSEQAAAGSPEGAILADGDHAGRVVMRDGGVVLEQIDPSVTAQGVVFGSIKRLAAERGDLVEPVLGTIVGYDEKFAAENGALWTDGALLHVPAGVKVELHLTYVVVQDRHDQSLHFAAHRAEIGHDATLEWAACSTGSKTGKTRMETRLIGAGSTGRLSGVFVVDQKRHLDLDTTQEHDAPNAISDLAFKGVLLDQARSVWRGVIRVAEGAHGTDAYQENRNLLLSPNARADSIPGLEIDTNDVRCTHGATAGPVDPMLKFYLRSRGIPPLEAERMIVEGFLEDALERIPNERIRTALTTAVMRRIPL